MKRTVSEQQARLQRSFAVTSLGKHRWFWIVWPSLDELESGAFGQDEAWGYERTKAQAVDRARSVAGSDAKHLAAKYAKQYHKFMRTFQRDRHGRSSTLDSHLTSPEFLYQDVRDRSTGRWFSVPHRIARKTNRYIYVERRPYDPGQLTGTWLDHSDETYRLSRSSLDREGYALAPVTANVDDPLFFTTPFRDRATRPEGHTPSCLARLGLAYPSTTAQVKAAYRRLAKRAHPDRGGKPDEFLALQAAYEQALRMCRD